MAAKRTYAGLDAQRREAQRREALLEAGLELLATVGAEKATMTAVCIEAGLTERYFYESFRTKSDLFAEVMARIAAELRSAARDAIDSTEGDETDRVRGAVRAFVTVLLSDPRKGRVAVVESVVAPVLRDQRQQTMSDFADFVVDESRSLWGDRVLPPPRDRLGAIMFVGACVELIAARLGGHIDASTHDIVEAATHLFVTSTMQEKP